MTRKRTIAGPDGVRVVDLTPEEIAAEDAAQKIYDDAEPARVMATLRKERNQRLAETDWWSLPDSPEMTDAQKSYRDALRQLPATEEDPANPTWPTKPE